MQKKWMYFRVNDNRIWVALLLIVSMTLVSCNKNGEDPGGNNPGNGDGAEPSVPVVQGDPEGTVTINLNNGTDGNWYDIGIGHSIHIDNANNFEGVDFVNLGEVDGLGYVTTIPTDGWSNTVAVVPGQGYVAHYNNRYARLYVVDYTISSQGGIMGATMKYQSPFQVPISLETTSLTFSNEAGTQHINLISPTSLSIVESLEWCEASINFNTITVSVTKNVSTEQRSGEIVLENELNTIRLNVLQRGIISFEGGSGTEQDPYLIKTEQQLMNINLALGAHYALVSDINMTSYLNGSEEDWESIGTSDNPFTGTFDGRGHTLSGMRGNSMFYSIHNATISNLSIVSGVDGIVEGGGIAQYCKSSTITRCAVSGVMKYAGIVKVVIQAGGISYKSRISDCFVTGTIISCMGGIVGESENESHLTIENSCVSGSLLGEGSFIGGIIGSGDCDVKKCYSEGQIRLDYENQTGTCAAIGKDVFFCWNCYSTSHLILNSPNGEVKFGGTSVVYGQDRDMYNNCYFAGRVTMGSNGLFLCMQGIPSSNGNNYYDSDEAGIMGGNGRTTAQMKHQSTYEGWDFVNTWRINEGMDYPRLRCFD